MSDRIAGEVVLTWEVIGYGGLRSMTYVFDEGTLMLEGVSLAEMVQFMVEMLVDLAAGAVFD